MKEVTKPWGYELWFAHTDRYVGKLLFVKAGERLSLQYHKQKDETLLVIRGLIRLTIGDDIRILPNTESIRITPEIPHRIEAITDALIVEVSTPEVDDVVRLEDDYGRECK
jgi:mannose-6-phosphate isomerase-like protein (cupin superfamily)